jgi:hypothetical protein
MDIITRSALKVLKNDIDAALVALGEKHGVVLETGNGRFSPSNATVKLKISCINKGGEVLSKEAEDFKQDCWKFGLQPEDLGKSFRSNVKEWKVVGLLPRSRKYPVLCERLPDGKRFKFPAKVVEEGLRQNHDEPAGRLHSQEK